MRKKIISLIGILVMIISVFALMGCFPEPENTIPYELGKKTTDYFEDNLDTWEELLVLIESMDELIQVMQENEFKISPMYEESFFEDHVLILYFYIEGIANDMELRLRIEDNTLCISKKFDMINGQGDTALRAWTFMIEIKKADIPGVTEVEIK